MTDPDYIEGHDLHRWYHWCDVQSAGGYPTNIKRPILGNTITSLKSDCRTKKGRVEGLTILVLQELNHQR